MYAKNVRTFYLLLHVDRNELSLINNTRQVLEENSVYLWKHTVEQLYHKNRKAIPYFENVRFTRNVSLNNLC